MTSKTYKVNIPRAIRGDMQEYELLGCPFCGEKPEIFLPDFNTSWENGFIRCINRDCGSQVQVSFLVREYSVLMVGWAVKQWNRRA